MELKPDEETFSIPYEVHFAIPKGQWHFRLSLWIKTFFCHHEFEVNKISVEQDYKNPLQIVFFRGSCIHCKKLKTVEFQIADVVAGTITDLFGLVEKIGGFNKCK